MEVFVTVAQVVAPIFTAIVLGILAKKFNWVNAENVVRKAASASASDIVPAPVATKLSTAWHSASNPPSAINALGS